MKRRQFLTMTGAAGTALWLPGAVSAAPSPPHSLLIQIELKGGNDGLNTVIPFDDPLYRALRPRIGVPRDATLKLDSRTGLHPSMQPLMALWRRGELAIVQGVGYAGPNRSHFRSTEIWDTASDADGYLHDGWLTRASQVSCRPIDRAVIGSAEAGPFRALHGGYPPCIAAPEDAARGFPGAPFDLTVPPGPFGAAIRTAVRRIATATATATPPVAGISIIRLTLDGFDTHQHQPARHAALLAALSEGIAALRTALVKLGRWDDALVLTCAEFGRHPRENAQLGTDHGTVAPHFVAGGRVRGGLYGTAPDLARLDGDGQLPFGESSVDYRALYATVLQTGWGIDAQAVLNKRFTPLPLLRA